jgi:hypothetical protein
MLPFGHLKKYAMILILVIVNINNKRDKYTVQGKKILLDRPMEVGGKY